MIHKKQLRFSFDGTDFEAEITYEDREFRTLSSNPDSIFYRVVLQKPREMNCGGEFRRISSISAAMLVATKFGKQHFGYMEGDRDMIDENSINIYPRAVKKILYQYFNEEKIEYYHKKITHFNEAIDTKYEAALQAVRAKRIALRKRMRAAEIDSKAYQKLYTPIRLEKDHIESRVFWAKLRYRNRYFDCCELKKKYRVDVPELTECYNAPLGYCEAGSDERITTNKKGA